MALFKLFNESFDLTEAASGSASDLGNVGTAFTAAVHSRTMRSRAQISLSASCCCTVRCALGCGIFGSSRTKRASHNNLVAQLLELLADPDQVRPASTVIRAGGESHLQYPDGWSNPPLVARKLR
jgi:hypothetical protein